MKLLLTGAVLALLTACSGAIAATGPYNNPPPGRVMQDVVAYLSGEAMNSKWHVVSSRVMIGKENGTTPAYQWYLSIYAPSANGWTLAYRSPGPGTNLLDKVTKAKGAQLWFPRQSLHIIGGAELEQPAVQDAVVQMMQSGADCGSATIAVLGAANKAMKPNLRVAVQNGCDLQAKIVKYGQMQALKLSGPYYNASAPMCCPTKPKATARLSYSGQIRGWSVTPNYFRMTKNP